MPETIHIKLPDGSEKEVPKGTTALEIAKGISPRLADAALAAKVSANGDQPALIDVTRPLERDTKLEILTERHPEARPALPIPPEQNGRIAPSRQLAPAGAWLLLCRSECSRPLSYKVKWPRAY